jgi:hypothetical protein
VTFIGPIHREPCIQEGAHQCPDPRCRYFIGGTELHYYKGPKFRIVLEMGYRSPTEEEIMDSLWETGRPALIRRDPSKVFFAWESIRA